MLEEIRKCLIDSKSLNLGLKEEIDFAHGKKIICEKKSINKFIEGEDYGKFWKQWLENLGTHCMRKKMKDEVEQDCYGQIMVTPADRPPPQLCFLSYEEPSF